MWRSVSFVQGGVVHASMFISLLEAVNTQEVAAQGTGRFLLRRNIEHRFQYLIVKYLLKQGVEICISMMENHVS